MPSDNSSKASDFFSTKKEYDNSYSQDVKNRTYDIWYERPYYGKIDTVGTPVFPWESAILKDLDEKAKHQALNFVADAFLDLQTFVKLAKIKGAFKGDFFGKFVPKKAWEPLPVLFDEYFENYVFDPFLNDYISTKVIRTFKCFAQQYLNFSRLISKDGTLTATGFVLSNNCTNKISGLILDLTSDDHDDSETKITDFLDDYQYSNFVTACAGYGFKVNKHAPWQLIADLSSKQMQNYANKYNILLADNSLFQNYFLRVSDVDYYNFKSYLWQMYSDWYAVNSTHSKIQVKVRPNFSSPMFSVFETKKLNEFPVEPSEEKNQFFAKHGELYFLKLYFRVRLIECDREKDYKALEY